MKKQIPSIGPRNQRRPPGFNAGVNACKTAILAKLRRMLAKNDAQYGKETFSGQGIRAAIAHILTIDERSVRPGGMGRK